MKALVINGDDFGMCRAVNAAVVRAHEAGVLSSASIMTCAPWFDDAAMLARHYHIPVGVHLTLACEWDRYRWRPITAARSFTEPDGTLPRTMSAVVERGDPAEVEAELRAQVERAAAAGLEPTHLDGHMGIVFPEIVARIAGDYGLPLRDAPAVAAEAMHVSFASRASFSSDGGDRAERLIQHLRQLREGVHLLVVHAGEDSDELANLASEGAPVWPWAREYRVADLAMLLDPAVRTTLNDLGIHLVSFAEAFRLAGERPGRSGGRAVVT